MLLQVLYTIDRGGKGKRTLKRMETPGWWVLRNQQWSGVPTLVKGEKGRVVWYWNGPFFAWNVLLSSYLVGVVWVVSWKY
jgi:hypothetical protein